jgi:lipoprotein Spr
MVKTLIPALILIAALSSCSSLKPTGNANSNSQHQVVRTSQNTSKPNSPNKDVKFLEDISVTANPGVEKKATVAPKRDQPVEARHAVNTTTVAASGKSPAIEKASSLQLKYAILLNVEVELLSDNALLEFVDEWYGTKYRMGGTTKTGVDCSAFVQAIYFSAFAVSLPRTARDQYNTARIISSTELREGDLVFFNTRGGVSHVGIYLQNNKFVHASTSNGVTISDLFDPYYLRRFIGAGRIEKSDIGVGTR